MKQQSLLKVTLLALALPASICLVQAFEIPRPTSTSTTRPSLDIINRKEALTGMLSIVGGLVATTAVPQSARADVSSGDMPSSAAQFNRIVRLKRDLKGVKKRVSENAADINKEEWDNIGKFLRQVYTTGDDMTAVAKSIKNADNYDKAVASIDKLKTYARAGDVSVSKQDGPGFVAVAEKMQGLVNDYFDALIDVPDEI